MERQQKQAVISREPIEPSKWRLRPPVSIAEIAAVAASEFECDPLKLGKFTCHTWAESSARAAACVVASETGHSYERIAEHFGIQSAKYLASVSNKWLYPPLKSQSTERSERVANIRAIVRERLSEADSERSHKHQSQSEANKDRNKQIALLRRKGWSIKGIARHCNVQPVEVCDVLGVDRALARAG